MKNNNPIHHLLNHDDKFDPWALEDGKAYSRERFYTRALDSRGHKETFHTSVPPPIFGAVAELVASKEFRRYRTAQDFVRDAIIHRLHDIAEMQKLPTQLLKTIQSAASYEIFLTQIDQMTKDLDGMKSLMENNESLLHKALEAGDMRRLERAIDSVNDQLEELEEPYLSQLRQIVRPFKIELHKMQNK